MKALVTLVLSSFFATCALHDNRPDVFYVACMILQIATLVGVCLKSFALVQIGHVGFAAALHVGAFRLALPDVGVVAVLCLATLLARHFTRGCLFDAVCGPIVAAWDPAVMSSFYSLPLVVIGVRVVC